VENFKYLGVILNEDNSNSNSMSPNGLARIKNANKTHFMLQKFF
jgi:hypothetical protein